MPPVEGDDVTGQKSPHKFSQRGRVCAEKEVDVISEKSPGKTIGFSRDQQVRETFNKIAVSIIDKNISPNR